MVRILTYNVHRCLGVDRHLDVGRIAAVIAAQAPDVVALQEVDVGRGRTHGVDQAHAIAQRLGMAFRFHPALRVEEELYGDAILTALPERLVKADALPGYARLPRLEPRGALWVAVEAAGVEIQVLNTHLGLVPLEQHQQAAALRGPDWLGGPLRAGPLVVVGDMNASPWSRTCRMLGEGLIDARRAAAAAAPTFPSAMPALRIDHVYVSRELTVTATRVPTTPLARRASDHLPLVVDLELRPSGPPARNPGQVVVAGGRQVIRSEVPAAPASSIIAKDTSSTHSAAYVAHPHGSAHRRSGR